MHMMTRLCAHLPRAFFLAGAALAALTLNPALGVHAQENSAVADRVPNRTEGAGPYNRLILRNATMIDGTGAPAQGPVDIVISGDRIAEIRSIGAPMAVDETLRAEPGDYEIDLTGKYVLPGFVDAHVHLHSLNDP